MTDYRRAFYERYRMSIGKGRLDQAHYEACATQFKGRWSHWLPDDKASPMLDLGCGCGEYLFFLRSMGYKNVFGVDLCDGELEDARRIGLTNLTCASIFDYLEDKKESFEVVSAFNVFEHFRKEEILRLLELILKALQPGGKLLAVTPNGLSPFSGTTRYWDFSHETSFTPACWRQIARITGFSDVQFEEYGPLSHSVLGIIRSALWILVKSAFSAISYIEVGGPRDVSGVDTADMKVILTKHAVERQGGQSNVQA